MSKTFEIKLDVEKNLYSPMQILFNVSSNDIGSIELQFEITQDESPFDLTGKTLQLGIKKPSGIVIYEGIGTSNAPEGKASAILPQNAYIESGIHVAELYVQDENETIVISPFYFNSWESIMATETVPEPTGDVYWQNILNKPLTFSPSAHLHIISDVTGLQSALDSKANVGETGGGGGTPDAHTHPIADVVGLQTALDGKADDAHVHTIANITNLQTTLDGKADDAHTHTIANITNLQTTLDGKADDVHTHTIANVTGLQTALDGKVDDAQLTTKADVDHDHAIADVTGLQTALDGKADDGDLAGKANVGASYLKTETYAKTELYNRTEIDQMTMGEGGGSPVIVEDNLASTSTTNALSANQGRILDTTKADVDHTHTEYALVDHTHTGFAPTDHDHAIADVTGLQVALDGKADDGHTHTKAEITDFAHTHAIADVTNLQTTLDGKADDGHTHTKAEITDFAHTHAIADVTNLQTTLDGKQPKPITTTALPTSVPTHAGQMAVDTTNKNTYIAEGTASGDWKKLVDAYDLSLKSDVGHTHTSANITDFGTAVSNNIPAEYLTQTEGDARYQATGTVPEHDHTKADITDFAHTHTKADITDFAHTHAIADVTNLQTTLDGKQPKPTSVTAIPTTVPTHLGQIAVDGTNKNTYIAEGTASGDWKKLVDSYDLSLKSDVGHTHTKANITDFAHTHTQADITFGGVNAQTYVDNGDNFIMNTKMAGLTLWKGTQASYDAIATKDPNTLYFIVG